MAQATYLTTLFFFKQTKQNRHHPSYLPVRVREAPNKDEAARLFRNSLRENLVSCLSSLCSYRKPSES
jgi:hypothetical protein